MSTDSIAWFLPAHNEQDNLPTVVPAIHAYLSKLDCPFSIIIVDDGSTDATDQVCQQLFERFAEVQIARHEVNQGYGAALRTGLKACLGTGHSLIGFCDADGQFDITNLTPMLSAIQKAEAVFGWRSARADGLKRLLMGRGWHFISKAMLRYDARDVDCGFKLFRREVVDAIAAKLQGGYAVISPEIIVRTQRLGFTTTDVKVIHKPRELGEQTGAKLHVVFGSFVSLWRLQRLLRQELREEYGLPSSSTPISASAYLPQLSLIGVSVAIGMHWSGKSKRRTTGV